MRSTAAHGTLARRRGGASAAYRIDMSRGAEQDLRSLRVVEQRRVRAALPQYLAKEPAAESNARKRLAANPFGVAWELRLGSLRAFYDVDEPLQVVRVERI